ncbi:MAG: hypothetical protein M3280_12410 [Actinomycetota bacterium]|nr:hypothetical protein [Actinomycetota bacterium]
MAALAYIFPPLSGLIAFLKGGTERVRFHGLQSVLLGAAWPAAVYLGSLFTPGATQVAFFTGLVLVIVAVIATALGADPRIPGVGRRLYRWASEAPRT